MGCRACVKLCFLSCVCLLHLFSRLCRVGGRGQTWVIPGERAKVLSSRLSWCLRVLCCLVFCSVLLGLLRLPEYLNWVSACASFFLCVCVRCRSFAACCACGSERSRAAAWSCRLLLAVVCTCSVHVCVCVRPTGREAARPGRGGTVTL